MGRLLGIVLCLLLAGASATWGAGPGRAVEGPSRSGAGAVVKAGPPLAYTRWEDPKEHSFSMDVPRGWDVRGGLTRVNSLDAKPTAAVTSPDGQIRIFLGDSTMPTCVVPTPMLEAVGFQEGAWYSTGGFNLYVTSYRTGAQFAPQWAVKHFGGQGATVRIMAQRDRADASRQVCEILARNGLIAPPQRLTFGEAKFFLLAGGPGQMGYVLAATFLNPDAMPGLDLAFWNLAFLCGFTAPEPRSAEAAQVLERIVASIRVNPEWIRRHEGLDGRLGPAVAEISPQVSRFIEGAFSRPARN